MLELTRWVNQGDQRYMNLFTCEEDGSFLSRVRFRKDPVNGSWVCNKLIYEADAELQGFYQNKASQSRRRGRSRGNRKSRSANKQPL